MQKDLVSEEEKVNKKLESIDRNILRASTIAKELLHLLREKETSFEPVNLNEVIMDNLIYQILVLLLAIYENISF